ncbi:MAG: lamin tail domain-containing protein [Candidatus Saccharimonadales bacterium]
MIFVTRIQQTIHISVAVIVLTIGLAISASAEATAVNSPLVIYQVQTGTPSSASQEYVAVYNNTDQAVDITNWCVVYASSSDVSQSQLSCLKPPVMSVKLFLKAHSSLLLATSEFVQSQPGFTPDAVFTAGIAATSGHIKLLDASKRLMDTVGWGAATKPEGSAIAAPAAGKILQRHQLPMNQLQDTNNNAADFFQTDRLLVVGGNIYEEVILTVDAPSPILSEILPNAAGADSGNEFIELYNPTNETINLAGYLLQLGPAFTKTYVLPATLLEPGAYLSLSDTQTGITLPNTAASVRLVSPNGISVSEVAYADLQEAVSFAYSEGSWQATYLPTPGSENIILASKPCPAGQLRSEETGQCKNVTPVASVLPCKEGQTRNIETGRCRNIVAVAAVTTCKVGQEKNPATGRCRNIAVVAPTKPCPAGQERNPNSGRCKKISAIVASGTNSVKDVPSPVVSSNMKLLIAGVAALSTVGYALYEWRHEVCALFGRLKSKITTSSLPT